MATGNSPIFTEVSVFFLRHGGTLAKRARAPEVAAEVHVRGVGSNGPKPREIQLPSRAFPSAAAPPEPRCPRASLPAPPNPGASAPCPQGAEAEEQLGRAGNTGKGAAWTPPLPKNCILIRNGGTKQQIASNSDFCCSKISLAAVSLLTPFSISAALTPAPAVGRGDFSWGICVHAAAGTSPALRQHSPTLTHFLLLSRARGII